MVEPSVPGVRTCMRCGWRFVSQDRERIRRCQSCKNSSEDEYTPRSGTVSGPGEVVRLAYKEY